MAEFRQGRHVWQQGQAVVAHGGEREDAAGAQLAQHVGHRGEHQPEPAADQVVQRWALAAIGHMGQRHAQRAAEHLASQMRGGAIAGGAEGLWLAPRLQRGEQASKAALGGPGLADRDDLRLHRDQGDGGVVPGGVVGQAALVQRDGRGLGAVAAHQQGVAVRRGVGDLRRADGATGAGAVLHHHGLAQRGGQALGQQPGLHVEAAAGREGHDDAQRPAGGPGGLGQGGAGQGRRGEEGGEHCTAVHGCRIAAVHGCGIARGDHVAVTLARKGITNASKTAGSLRDRAWPPRGVKAASAPGICCTSCSAK